ncbi:phospholipid carrier-dependent glycosyltransferase [Kineosporia rhizophila]|uniref:dolichyl-phosphate-mannose--protein mannosyltransferase n=1 Tax=Kineosporia sp. NBRC 101677 TaxID=3032197 RepID=UPI001E54CA34|nr:phospholipid carrier-dependent glycosyltransferase [Kineosporia sp. NBRC 101677]MCE0535114.1 phospholipid carrier-dependent glycosyltransferase [Kineosporia rhizophila]
MISPAVATRAAVRAVRPPSPTQRSPRLTLRGWLAVLAVTAFGGFIRFWHLGTPGTLVFDETYYVKQGWSMIEAGYELAWKGKGEEVDPLWNRGDTDVFLSTPDFVVHPPVGKWMIGLGEWIFGPTSAFGWRFASAVVGTLSILMIILIARRLFGSTLLGLTAGLLLAIDGQHFVHSRTGLLDVFVMFWALAAFGCVVADRDMGRRRLALRAATEFGEFGEGREQRAADSWSWWMGVRWWRIAAAVCLGLCAGTKWSGLYFALVFGIMIILWDAGARRAAGLRHWFAGSVIWGALSGTLMLAVAFATYLLSWTGWFLSSDAYDRRWAQDHPGEGITWLPGALRSLAHYHQQMWDFNINLAATHPYEANPWSWIVVGRPTAFYYEDPKRGELGCAVDVCSQAITALGNPVIWWGATLGIVVLLFCWVLRRDWRAGAVLAGLAAGYLPWFQYQHRTIFNFYTIAFTPWVVLTVVYVLGLILGRRSDSARRRRNGAWIAGTLVLLAVLCFWFFLPLYTAQVIPQPSWSDRMWLPSWI